MFQKLSGNKQIKVHLQEEAPEPISEILVPARIEVLSLGITNDDIFCELYSELLK